MQSPFKGNCLESDHSLHITISAYQLNSWTDLLEKLLPAALAVASTTDKEFREVSLEAVLKSKISFVHRIVKKYLIHFLYLGPTKKLPTTPRSCKQWKPIRRTNIVFKEGDMNYLFVIVIFWFLQNMFKHWFKLLKECLFGFSERGQWTVITQSPNVMFLIRWLNNFGDRVNFY